MGTIHLILPDALCEQVRELAGRYNVTVNLLVATVIAEKLLTLHTEEKPAKRHPEKHVSERLKGERARCSPQG